MRALAGSLPGQDQGNHVPACSSVILRGDPRLGASVSPSVVGPS